MSTLDAFRSAGNTPGTSEGGRAVAAERVSLFLPGALAGEIDDLMGELQYLRKKLLIDSDRIQQDIMQYAALGQVVAELIQVSAYSVARLTGSDFAEVL